MSGTERGQAWPGSKARLVTGVLAFVLALDLLSKGWIRARLELGESSPLLGDWLRLTYLLNPGAAFGVHVGAWSRPAFAFLALVSVGVILALVRRTPSAERLHLTAFALVMGGALGNIVDRLRPHGAVVDFLDVGLGAFRWPVFNVADVGVTAGVLLLLVSWRAGGAGARSVPARSASGESRSPDPP